MRSAPTARPLASIDGPEAKHQWNPARRSPITRALATANLLVDGRTHIREQNRSSRLAKIAAPLEAPLINASGGRLRLNLAVPMVVLTSLGAKSGERRETPLAYFTDADDVILIASNYGGTRHPAWYHNLRANPKCELHIGPRGGSFVAKQVTDKADRDRLYGLAVDRLAGVFALHDKRSGEARTIPVMRLTPVDQAR